MLFSAETSTNAAERGCAEASSENGKRADYYPLVSCCFLIIVIKSVQVSSELQC